MQNGSPSEAEMVLAQVLGQDGEYTVTRDARDGHWTAQAVLSVGRVVAVADQRERALSRLVHSVAATLLPYSATNAGFTVVREDVDEIWTWVLEDSKGRAWAVAVVNEGDEEERRSALSWLQRLEPQAIPRVLGPTEAAIPHRLASALTAP